MGSQILIPPGGVIGAPEDRVDGRLKVTGGARYSAEMPIHDVLYAVLVTSTIASGEITAMDTVAAQSRPGVVAVLTPFNAPKVPNNPGSPGILAGARPQQRVLQLLQDNAVLYNNQPIGMVVADTLEGAQHAASLVKVTYDARKPVTDIDSQRAVVYKPAKANQAPTDSHRGDADAALRRASKKIDYVYSTPYENHNPMEPHATIAIWEDGNQKLTVYDATQGIFGVQGVLAKIWNLDPANVRCLTYFVGGGFGCKGSVWSHVPLATLAARVTGRPVKLVLSRQQMFGMVGYRPTTEQEIALGSDNKGKLNALKHDVYTMTSVFDEFVESSAAASRMLYACDNASTSHHLARLNQGTPTFMRAPGESSGTYALEMAMDELAYAAGVDPLQMRLINYAETDPDENKPFSSKSLRECYAVGAKAFGWDKRTMAPKSMRTADGLLVGYGIGTATYPTRRSPASARARINKDGSGWVGAGTQDIGTGTYTVMKQIASDALGTPYDQTTFVLGDTRLPNTPVSGGSQTAASTGSAVLQAGQAVQQQLIAAAVADPKSPLSGLQATDVSAKDGRLYATADPSRGESYAQFMARQSAPFLEVVVKAAPDQDKDAYSMHSFGAVFTEVHVDPDLGIARVARVVGAYGIGNRLNAKTARSQLMGGMVFGIGMAMMEETHYDLRNGRVVNPDLAEYHVPVNADVPRLDVIFVDEVDPHINPLGIKGCGEIGITGIVGSIGNAIYHATGVRVRDLPFTLDKVALG